MPPALTITIKAIYNCIITAMKSRDITTYLTLTTLLQKKIIIIATKKKYNNKILKITRNELNTLLCIYFVSILRLFIIEKHN